MTKWALVRKPDTIPGRPDVTSASYMHVVRKRLIRVGNSYALVIDKRLRERLSLAPSREVEVTTDGRRLLIVPVHEPGGRDEASSASTGEAKGDLPLAILLDAPGVADRLSAAYGMGEEKFQRLQPGMRTFGRYCVWTRMDGEALAADHHANLRATIRRMHECLRILEAGAGWDHAIAEALRREPPVPI